MAWNEPGGGNRDPWSGGGKNQGPPDLDEVFRKVRNRIDRLFGRRSSGRGDNDGGGGAGGGFNLTAVAAIAAVLLIGWLATGIYIVDEGQRGVVTRFGAHVYTAMPGPHWHYPFPIEAVEEVNVDQRRRITVGYNSAAAGSSRPVLSEALMLTQDENIVNVQLAVQYRVGDPAAYLFSFRHPDETLKSVTESVLREIVGKRTMDFVLTEGRAEVVERTSTMVQEIIDRYGVGIEVVQVAIQDIQPPEQVQGAFLDAIKAREDKQRIINEAQAYRNEVIPRAQGETARILEASQGYKASVIADAEGDTSRFTQLAGEYNEAPGVTRERLYLETMQEVLGSSGKVLLDIESGGPLIYLPLDKIIQRSAANPGGAGGDSANPAMQGGFSSSTTSSADGNSMSSSYSSRGARTRETR